MRKMISIDNLYGNNVLKRLNMLFKEHYDTNHILILYHGDERLTYFDRNTVTLNSFLREIKVRAKHMRTMYFGISIDGKAIPYFRDFIVFFDMMDYLRFV